MGRSRGILGSVLDRSIGWYLGLSPEKCGYRVSRAVHIPMRDGIDLLADLYQPRLPSTESPAPVLLVQGCYGRGFAIALLHARFFAARGYHVLLVSCRGTFGSGGEFEPFRSERIDGQDIVEWMRVQSWYPGSFATFGSSYHGYTQWALLHDSQVDCVGACIPVGPHDYAKYHWGTGSLRLDRISWGDSIAHQEEARVRIIPPKSRLDSNESIARSTYLTLPFVDGVSQYLNNSAPWVLQAMTHPDLNDPYWEALRHDAALDSIDVPVLLVSGWHDAFNEQTLEQYARLTDRNCQVYLIVGPWAHDAATGIKSMPDIIKFFDHHIGQGRTEAMSLPVRVFVTGAKHWRYLPNWPPPFTRRTLYLSSDKSLRSEEPPEDAEVRSFVFHPSDPPPTIGGRMLVSGGRFDDSLYTRRSDVLVYTSCILSEETEVLGRPVVELAHSSDTPHVDLWVRLSEVNQRGVSHNVTEQYQVLDPKRDTSETIRLELGDCAHRFRKGTRIRLIIAGGSMSQYARNLGTGESRITGTAIRSALHSIRHSLGKSRLHLPTPIKM